MSDPIKITGYHATHRKNYESIIMNGLYITKNTDTKFHWLGDGIYLFQYPSDAESWGKDVENCKEDPITLLVEAEVNENKFLDLDNPEDMDRLKLFIEVWLEEAPKQDLGKKTLRFKNELELMSWGLNEFKTVIETDLVKYTFVHSRTRRSLGYSNFTEDYLKKNQKKKSRFDWVRFPYNEVQYCLTDNQTITNKEIYQKE